MKIDRPKRTLDRLAEPRTETEISAAIRLALSEETDLVLWRQSIGVFDVVDKTGEVRKQRAGLPNGSADLIGILRVGLGRFIALEVKTKRGVLSEAQKLWLPLVRQYGGFACVVRSVADARAAIARARTGAVE